MRAQSHSSFREPAYAAPPATLILVAQGGLFAFFAYFRDELAATFSFFDGVNLAFHEGGHIIFGLFGNRFLMVAGGTLMQLLLPFAAMVHFSNRKERVSEKIALFWLGQNLLGIGTYVADARAQLLNLVAGGVHDWTYLLDTMGVLIHDVEIGKWIRILGCAIMASALVDSILAWREERQRAKIDS